MSEHDDVDDRILESLEHAEAARAVATCVDAVLVGGAALPAAVGERAADQLLHQTTAVLRRLPGDMLDQPVTLAALHPAVTGIAAARDDGIGIHAGLCRDFLDRRAGCDDRPGRRHRAQRGSGDAIDLSNQEMGDVVP